MVPLGNGKFEEFRLRFEKSEYKQRYLTAVNNLNEAAATLFVNLMERTIGCSGEYNGKITMGAKPFAVHLYDSDNMENVVAWFYPTSKYVNVRLFRGTNYGAAKGMMTRDDLRGTPHTINLRLDKMGDIDAAVACIKDSARRRK